MIVKRSTLNTIEIDKTISSVINHFNNHFQTHTIRSKPVEEILTRAFYIELKQDIIFVYKISLHSNNEIFSFNTSSILLLSYPRGKPFRYTYCESYSYFKHCLVDRKWRKIEPKIVLNS